MIPIKLLNYICHFLILLVIIFTVKIAIDFDARNQSATSEKRDKIYIDGNYIINPRLQVESDDFKYVVATKGFVNDNDEYTFEKIHVTCDYGTITAGRLMVSKNADTLVFDDQVKFTVYLHKFKNV